ncbi:MAG TPA: porin family protein [Burkholderiales bacterium]|nr:porin family protein [Burkholderiales bacterium]
MEKGDSRVSAIAQGGSTQSGEVRKHFSGGRAVTAGALALSFFLAPAAWAQTQESKMALGVRLGLAFPAEEFNDFTGKKPDTGQMLNLDLMFKASSNLDIGGSLEYQTNKMPSISGPGTAGGLFGGAKITVLTAMAAAQYRFNRAAKFSPYGVAGIGFNINWMDDDNSGFSFEVDPSLALKFGLGADYYFSKSTALNVEAGYKINNSTVTRSPTGGGTSTFDFNMSTLYLLGGLRFSL